MVYREQARIAGLIHIAKAAINSATAHRPCPQQECAAIQAGHADATAAPDASASEPAAQQRLAGAARNVGQRVIWTIEAGYAEPTARRSSESALLPGCEWRRPRRRLSSITARLRSV